MNTSTPVPSPCINVCRMDAASGWCEGCLRSLDEIAAWSRLDDEARRAVWAQLDARRVQWLARRPPAVARPAPATAPNTAPNTAPAPQPGLPAGGPRLS